MKKIRSKKTSQISIRMTPLERMLIESRAKESGRSMSQFMVEAAIGKEMKILSAEEKKAYQDLANFHTNFARLGNLVRAKDPGLFLEIQKLLQEIQNHLQTLSNGK